MALATASGNAKFTMEGRRGEENRGLTVSLASRNAPAHVAS